MTTTLFTGGPIRTLAGESTEDWILIENDRIVSTGKTMDEPTAHRRVDLGGATLAPAFCDGHVHLPATGLYAAGMDFRGETSALRITEAFRSAVKDGEGVLFGGNFEDPLDQPLLARDLDAAVGERPALLARADMHSCIASTSLLNALDLADIEGVDRDPSGAPTGYLREQAASVAWKWFENNLPPETQKAAIRSAVRLAYAKGIARVHEMFVVEWRGWDSLEIFLDAIDPVALEVTPYLGTTDVARVKELGLPRIGGDWFLDGSFGSHTAWLTEPYAGTPPSGSSPYGIAYRTDEEVYEFFSEAQRAGLQVGVHAIGDAAILQAIETWEAVALDVGIDEVRRLGHRIEHFECAGDDHIRRAAHLGLRASVQPAFDHYWGGRDGLYSKRMGPIRALAMNRFKSMLQAGLVVGAGSDSTVTPLDPFLQVASLRTHHIAGQQFGPLKALRAHTVGSNMLTGTTDRGTIAPGNKADLIMLDRDPLTIDPEELLKTEVLGTWIAGKRVWPERDAESQ
jgi:predicted amidohydrolase YtcJ